MRADPDADPCLGGDVYDVLRNRLVVPDLPALRTARNEFYSWLGLGSGCRSGVELSLG